MHDSRQIQCYQKCVISNKFNTKKMSESQTGAGNLKIFKILKFFEIFKNFEILNFVNIKNDPRDMLNNFCFHV